MMKNDGRKKIGNQAGVHKYMYTDMWEKHSGDFEKLKFPKNL